MKNILTKKKVEITVLIIALIAGIIIFLLTKSELNSFLGTIYILISSYQNQTTDSIKRAVFTGIGMNLFTLAVITRQKPVDPVTGSYLLAILVTALMPRRVVEKKEIEN